MGGWEGRCVCVCAGIRRKQFAKAQSHIGVVYVWPKDQSSDFEVSHLNVH